jgi:hypothetical protein
LRQCARWSRVRFPVESLEFFIDSRTITLRLTQPLTEMSTRNISWGKVGRCVGLTTLPPSFADCLEIWEPRPPGILRACSGLYRDCFTFTVQNVVTRLDLAREICSLLAYTLPEYTHLVGYVQLKGTEIPGQTLRAPGG